ncbi:MAG TPA: hypothetical protein VFX60_05535 [Micromonospora sp.]|nr:hypothetical protein [Micromonospora sp.]
METTADIPVVGGPADGTVLTVELDPTGRPPLTHHHISDEGLSGADMYELETVAGEQRRWIYRWRPTAA